MSLDFRQALMREILKTEQVRIKTLIAAVLAMTILLGTAHLLVPQAIDRLWHGRVDPVYLGLVLLPFLAFELMVLRAVRSKLALGRDLAAARRYFGAFIETSLPTLVLSVHITNMGSVQALSFIAPFIYFFFIILSTLRLDFWLSAFTGLVASVELFAMAMLYHPDAPPDLVYHLVRSIVILMCGLVAGAVSMQLRHQFETSIAAVTARDRVTNLFGQHVSPQVVERLLAEGTLSTSDTRRVAVMFVDFRSFTTDAQSRTPQQVVDRLDGAFAVLVDILDRHGGIVNKFLGDGFLALFGAPFESTDAPRRAVEAAREMIDAMEHNNAGSDWPLRIGIGLHVGEVVAGNIGSPRRKEYTVIGDTVNLASRIESLNKQFGSQCLISAAVHEALGQGAADAVSLGDVAVRGYDRPIAIWRLG